MKTTAVRLYSKGDLRLETFELPAMNSDEILCRIVTDGLCISSYKAQLQGHRHRRIPNNIATHPIILGHEFSGEIVKVGRNWANEFEAGQKFVVQPALNYKDGPAGVTSAPGYSYSYVGGNATYVILPREVMEQKCLMTYDANAFYIGSMTEPLSCVIGAVKANYHCNKKTKEHQMGIRKGGNVAILGGTGSMGLTMLSYFLFGDNQPKCMVVTGKTPTRIKRAESLFTVATALKRGIDLHYVNWDSSTGYSIIKPLMNYSKGLGYDDVFVLSPTEALLEAGSSLLAPDGCLNFFAGPTNQKFSASINFYKVHYSGHHFVGTSGGDVLDMRKALDLIVSNRIDMSHLITHIGGLNSVVHTTKHLPEIRGGRKLIYTGKDLPLTAIADFAKRGKHSVLFETLAQICRKYKNTWNPEAEDFLLKAAPNI